MAWQDPGYTTFRAMTGNLFNVQPKLRVLSDSGPVNGSQPAVNMKSSCIEIVAVAHDDRRCRPLNHCRMIQRMTGW